MKTINSKNNWKIHKIKIKSQRLKLNKVEKLQNQLNYIVFCKYIIVSQY